MSEKEVPDNKGCWDISLFKQPIIFLFLKQTIKSVSDSPDLHH